MLRDILSPLYRWIREQYGLDAGPVIVQVGQHRLEIPPLPAITHSVTDIVMTQVQREILTYLLTGPKTLDAISAKLDHDRSSLHRRHLKPLLTKGLVGKSKEGYVLTPAGLAEADRVEIDPK